MQSASNGVIFENGSGPVANGDLLLTNGCEREDGDTMERNIAVIQKKKQQRQLTGMDVDTIRLIGQHLRRMGFQ